MSFILDISTAVPEYAIAKQELVKFYADSLEVSGLPAITKKLGFLMEKTKINNRYSSIPDFAGKEYELFSPDNYRPPVERIMKVYKDKSLPLAIKAIDPLLGRNKVKGADITHLITVSCTGLFAPGLEFLVADHYGLQHAEKIAVNFLGCYAGIKALKHAHYIAAANPGACVLVVCVELCSLHFTPSVTDEDIVANLIFADGAAALLVCGNENDHLENKLLLHIDSIGSACIPNSADLMTWEISSAAFRMYLSKHLVKNIEENIEPVVNEFLMERRAQTDYWAIHPGGVKIVEAVKASLYLGESNVEDSLQVLKDYGNMSSPTILFILHRLFNKIRKAEQGKSKSIFACAFGPGITVEMVQLSSVYKTPSLPFKNRVPDYAVPA
ncbi:MAG: type III polyketide synthase [Chitinophagaceae bacterium]|nr:type III polyketide synthase [Chitinophagaceae bacterium]